MCPLAPRHPDIRHPHERRQGKDFPMARLCGPLPFWLGFLLLLGFFSSSSSSSSSSLSRPSLYFSLKDTGHRREEKVNAQEKVSITSNLVAHCGLLVLKIWGMFLSLGTSDVKRLLCTVPPQEALLALSPRTLGSGPVGTLATGCHHCNPRHCPKLRTPNPPMRSSNGHMALRLPQGIGLRAACHSPCR